MEDFETQADLTPRVAPLGGAARGASLGNSSSYVGTLIGPYQVVKELARGGMGVVYVARHVELDRLVALKQILAPEGQEAKLIRRLEEEARTAGKLRHPNIIRVHEVVEHEGYPYMAMEFVEGQSLAGQLKSAGRFEQREAAEIAMTLALAVQHAHDHGILHRDIKPGNVLVEEDGRLVLTDFGLARDREREKLTQTGAAIGSPGYMPPEQADGDLKSIGPPSDVYALGATLFALLSARPPFKGSSPVRVLAKILTSAPPTFEQLGLSVHRDLECIVMKALEKAPGDRYGTCKEFAAELERFLDGEEVLTRPMASSERMQRWVAKRSGLLLTSLLAVSVVVAALIAILVLRPKEALDTGEAPTAVRKRTRADREAARKQRKGKAELDRIALEKDPARALERIAEWRALYPGHPETSRADALHEAVRLDAPRGTFVAKTGRATRIAFLTPTRYLTWGDSREDGYTHGPIEVRDVTSTDPLASFMPPFQLRALKVVDETLVLVAGFVGNGVVASRLDLASGTFKRYTSQGNVPQGIAVAFRPDEDSMAVSRDGPAEQALVIYQLLTGETRVLNQAGRRARLLRYSRDGRFLLGASGEGLTSGNASDTLRAWDLDREGPDPVFNVPGVGRPYYLDLGPDLTTFVVGASSGTALLFDLEDPERGTRRLIQKQGQAGDVFGVELTKAHQSPVRAGAFSRDGERLYTVSGDDEYTTPEDPLKRDPLRENSFAVWDLTTDPPQELRRVLRRDSIQSIALAGDQGHMVLSDVHGFVEVWPLR